MKERSWQTLTAAWVGRPPQPRVVVRLVVLVLLGLHLGLLWVQVAHTGGLPWTSLGLAILEISLLAVWVRSHLLRRNSRNAMLMSLGLLLAISAVSHEQPE